MLTLKDVADEEQIAAQAAADRAAARLAAADAELRDAESARREAATLFTALGAKDADLRRRLAAAAGGMPADTAALSDEVELNTVALRAQGAKANAAERALAAAKQALTTAGQQVRDAQTRLAAAKATATAAAERAKQLDEAQVALGQPPLKTVAAAATTAINQDLKKADQRIATDVPKQLLDRAKARLKLNHHELKAAETVALQAATATARAAAAANGLAAAAAQQLAELQAAEAAYLATLTRADALTRANAAVAAVQAAPEISPERRARMTGGAVVEDGKTATELEEKRDAARQKLLDARAAFEQKWIAALEAQAVDPAQVAEVKTARDGVNTAVGALADAEMALDTPPAAGKPTPREAFGRWEATVPIETWNGVVAVVHARRTLEELKATKPAELRAALATAEDAYALARRKATSGERTIGELASLASERAATAALAIRTNSELSAVRGDL